MEPFQTRETGESSKGQTSEQHPLIEKEEVFDNSNDTLMKYLGTQFKGEKCAQEFGKQNKTQVKGSSQNHIWFYVLFNGGCMDNDWLHLQLLCRLYHLLVHFRIRETYHHQKGLDPMNACPNKLSKSSPPPQANKEKILNAMGSKTEPRRHIYSWAGSNALALIKEPDEEEYKATRMVLIIHVPDEHGTQPMLQKAVPPSTIVKRIKTGSNSWSN